MIRIILADNHSLVRESVKSLLENTGKFHVVGTAATGQQVLDLLTQNIKADIILADADLPALSGTELADVINRIAPEVKVVLLTTNNHEGEAISAFQYGVHGYLLKNVDTDELFFALHRIANQKKYICQDLGLSLLNQLSQSFYSKNTTEKIPDFSPRELEVLNLVSNGYTNQEIANKLFTSRRTVEGHRLALLGKAGVRNTSSLIKFAVMNRIIT